MRAPPQPGEPPPGALAVARLGVRIVESVIRQDVPPGARRVQLALGRARRLSKRPVVLVGEQLAHRRGATHRAGGRGCSGPCRAARCRRSAHAARRKATEQEDVLQPQLLLQVQQPLPVGGRGRRALQVGAPEHDVLAPLLEKRADLAPRVPAALLAQVRQHAVRGEAPLQRRAGGRPVRRRSVGAVALAQRVARRVGGELQHGLVLPVREPELEGLEHARPAAPGLLRALGPTRAGNA